MDLGDPTKAIVPTLDGPVLAVLARTGRPLTAGEVAAQTRRGSEIGVRRVLARLVEQGVLRSHQMGRNRVHELNRDHIAADVAIALSGFRTELWRRMRETLRQWDPGPVYACVFGSAARGNGDATSDIDVLVVHPSFPDEPTPKAEKWAAAVATLTLGAASRPHPLLNRPPNRAHWNSQIDKLYGQVFSWTGNRLQILDLSPFEWTSADGAISSELRAEIARDAIDLTPPRVVRTN